MLFLIKKISIIFCLLCCVFIQSAVKDWTVLIYMSADNDLGMFSRRNLAQIMSIGSNNHVNLLVQLDTKVPDGKKITKRYYVEHNKLVITNQNQRGMDSGDAETLISAVRWAQCYPSKHFMLVLWNHGTGIIDATIKSGTIPRSINPSLLFNLNPTSHLLELDRSIAFLDYAQSHYPDPRGICYDDSTGHYLTNQKLEYALKTITQTILKKKIDIIGFDACLMSMVEIAAILKEYAYFMVGSQEVELGTGWDYQLIFSTLCQRRLRPTELCDLIVKSYQTTYQKITPDYTQSAIELSYVTLLENNIDQVAQLLIKALHHQSENSVRQIIKISSHRQFCTHFDEPSYIDIHHFYKNLLSNSINFKFKNTTEVKNIIGDLQTILLKGKSIIEQLVISNVVGSNILNAKGLSIYLPEYVIHPSYKKTTFALSNHWYEFLTILLS